MLLQIRDQSKIENPREYATNAVEHLRGLLAEGAQAQHDPHRENFYLLEDEKGTYYIHISPITGNVVLLANWARQPQNCFAGAGSLVA